MSTETYTGRLVTEGGHLMAHEATKTGEITQAIFDASGNPVLDELGAQLTITLPVFKYGKLHRRPVAYDPATNSYVLLKPGEPSHNDRFHQQFVGVETTQAVDPEQPGFAGTPDDPVEGREHHWSALPDDPHYSEGATDSKGVVTNTLTKSHPDTVAPLVTGHTDSYEEAHRG